MSKRLEEFHVKHEKETLLSEKNLTEIYKNDLVSIPETKRQVFAALFDNQFKKTHSKKYFTFIKNTFLNNPLFKIGNFQVAYEPEGKSIYDATTFYLKKCDIDGVELGGCKIKDFSEKKCPVTPNTTFHVEHESITKLSGDVCGQEIFTTILNELKEYKKTSLEESICIIHEDNFYDNFIKNVENERLKLQSGRGLANILIFSNHIGSELITAFENMFSKKIENTNKKEFGLLKIMEHNGCSFYTSDALENEDCYLFYSGQSTFDRSFIFSVSDVVATKPVEYLRYFFKITNPEKYSYINLKTVEIIKGKSDSNIILENIITNFNKGLLYETYEDSINKTSSTFKERFKTIYIENIKYIDDNNIEDDMYLLHSYSILAYIVPNAVCDYFQPEDLYDFYCKYYQKIYNVLNDLQIPDSDCESETLLSLAKEFVRRNSTNFLDIKYDNVCKKVFMDINDEDKSKN